TVAVNGIVGDGMLRLDLSGLASFTDSVGNNGSGAYTSGESYTIDNTAPLAPTGLYAVADNGPVNGGVTFDDTLSVCGTSEAFAVITVDIDTVYAGQATAAANGSWCFD